MHAIAGASRRLVVALAVFGLVGLGRRTGCGRGHVHAPPPRRPPAHRDVRQRLARHERQDDNARLAGDAHGVGSPPDLEQRGMDPDLVRLAHRTAGCGSPRSPTSPGSTAAPRTSRPERAPSRPPRTSCTASPPPARSTEAEPWRVTGCHPHRHQRSGVDPTGVRASPLVSGDHAGWWLPRVPRPLRRRCAAPPAHLPAGTTGRIVPSVPAPAATGEIALTFDMGGRMPDAVAIMHLLVLGIECARPSSRPVRPRTRSAGLAGAGRDRRPSGAVRARQPHRPSLQPPGRRRRVGLPADRDTPVSLVRDHRAG